jgi:hypothetical protein
LAKVLGLLLLFFNETRSEGPYVYGYQTPADDFFAVEAFGSGLAFA